MGHRDATRRRFDGCLTGELLGENCRGEAKPVNSANISRIDRYSGQSEIASDRLMSTLLLAPMSQNGGRCESNCLHGSSNHSSDPANG